MGYFIVALCFGVMFFPIFRSVKIDTNIKNNGALITATIIKIDRFGYMLRAHNTTIFHFNFEGKDYRIVSSWKADKQYKVGDQIKAFFWDKYPYRIVLADSQDI